MDATWPAQSQQRYWPWGTARNASGTLPTDYRYTWQQEVGVIELYDYDARWYDPDLKRFVQADSVVPEPRNPQSLNRYSYVFNSPVVHRDPSGHDVIAEAGYWPNARDPEWVKRYREAHGGAEPNQQDWRDYVFSLTHAGTGPGGSWTKADWQAYGKVQDLLGELLAQRGNAGLRGPRVYSMSWTPHSSHLTWAANDAIIDVLCSALHRLKRSPHIPGTERTSDNKDPFPVDPSSSRHVCPNGIAGA